MVVALPADVLLLVCEELGNRQDFRTLYKCALSSKVLVVPALSWLYRVHNQSEYFRGDENDAGFASKWGLLWKSIIRSSLGNTAYPYCLYIRSLDLRNLATLLDDRHFQNAAMESFFAGDMAKFLKAQETPVKLKTRHGKKTQKRTNVPLILDLVGESVTNFVSQAAHRNRTTVALEDIAGDINSLALSRWTGRLSRLKSVTLYDGAVLNEDVATSINNHCSSFDDLTVKGFSMRDDVDAEVASFFSTLRSNSLQSVTVLSAQAVGPAILLALNNHSQSLTTLKLDELKADGIKNLNLLQGCKALEVLDLQDSDGFINLEATENDVFLEVIAWLAGCDRLRELAFKKLISAPAILTNVCLRNNIRLKKLELYDYSLLSSQDLHQAISLQTTLESLILRADPEGAFGDDIDILVSSVTQLTNLKELDIVDTSDYFSTPNIKQIALSLRNLEKFSFSGHEVTDDLWPSLAGLHQLRALDAQALTFFTSDGLLNYISTLQPTNEGLLLSVPSQNGENDLSDAEKTIIQESIWEKVGGKFEFDLYRDVDSEFGSEAD